MSDLDKHIDDADEGDDETMVRFILTLIVATLIVAVSGYVLTRAVEAPEKTVHGTASLTHAVRS
jgi:hypothetical protein